MLEPPSLGDPPFSSYRAIYIYIYIYILQAAGGFGWRPFAEGEGLLGSSHVESNNYGGEAYIYIYTHRYVYIYIYIEREREI